MKPIPNTEDRYYANVVYHSAAEAARMLGLNDYSHIYYVCQHQYGHHTVGGYHFEYYKEQ